MKLMIRAHDLGTRGIDNVAECATRHGLDGIQLVAYKSLDEVSYKRGAITEEIAKNVHETLHKHSLSVPLLGAYFNPIHPNSEKVELGMDVFCEYLSLANSFGAYAVGTESGSLMGDPWGYHEGNRTERSHDIVTERFAFLARRAREENTHLALEGAFNHVYHSPDSLMRAYEKIGDERVKIIFDLYNYLDKSNVADMYSILERGLDIFKDKFLLFHIKDCVINPDGTLKQCGVGQGIFDFERILSMISGVCPHANLVLEGTTGDDIAFAVNHLRPIIKRYT